MPPPIRRLVKNAAIRTAARELESVDDSSWVVRAICEKLVREARSLGLTDDLPNEVLELGGRAASDRQTLIPVGMVRGGG